MISLGQFIPGYLADEHRADFRVTTDDPDLASHTDQPWLRAYAAERLNLTLPAPPAAPVGRALEHRDARVSDDALAHHAVLCGATGSGKTRLALHLVAEQIRAGRSVVMLDPKAETLMHLLQLARAAGLPAEAVTLLSPAAQGVGAPGWNPLDGAASGVPAVQSAAALVSVLAQSAPDSWGHRLQDLLTNALIVIASHRLSLFELARFLRRDDYREGLLRRPVRPEALSDPFAYAEATEFFSHEFGRWGAAEQRGAVAPVLNKFRELLRSPFLRSLLCARRTTLDLAALWRRPGLVLVHLDRVSLGDEGTRLLGGLLAHQLEWTAERTSGPVPVVLALDEVGIAERFLGSTAARILAIARSRNLRLLVACQHLAQLSGELRTALLANTAVQAFFRVGHEDARHVASWLAAGTGSRVAAVSAEMPARGRVGEEPIQAQVFHDVCDGYGQPLRLAGPGWSAFRDFARVAPGDRQREALGRLAAVSGVQRLYVRAADTRAPVELGKYVRGLAGHEYFFAGPAPVKLVVSFPRPRLSVSVRETESEREQRWLRTLMDLPKRHALLSLAGQPPGVLRVVDVADLVPSPDLARFMSAAAAYSGQSAEELDRVLQARSDEMDRVAALAAPSVSPATGPSSRPAPAAPPNGSAPKEPGQTEQPTPLASPARSGRVRPPVPATRPRPAAEAAPVPQAASLPPGAPKAVPQPPEELIGGDGSLA